MAVCSLWPANACRKGDFLSSRCIMVMGAMAMWWLMPGLLLGAPPEKEAVRFVPDPASVVRYGPGWCYPQAGWNVVHIEGSAYDRGYQHGRLLAGEIADYVATLAAVHSSKAPHAAWREVRRLADALFLRKYEGEFLDEMKGIADGAATAGARFDNRRLDLIDIVAINSEIEIAFLDHGLEASATGLDDKKYKAPQYPQPKARPHEHCSAFVATGKATTDGRIVLGHITMSEIDVVRYYHVWLDIQPAQGHRVVMQTFPGGIHSGLDYYVNDAGMIVAETTVRQTKFNLAGKPLASRIRRAVQYADSIDKAVEILSDSSNGLYTNQWLFADIKTDEIAMFELGTDRTRLWRSSREEWLAGTQGFYWGCNNSHDVEVLKETVPDLGGKPANLVYYPHSRDKAWLALFKRDSGKIGEGFAFESLTSTPLAAFPSCDAKFTTTALAGRLESWALFGPPRGRTWEPSSEDRKKHPDAKPLVSNDWTLMTVTPPANIAPNVVPVDLEPFPEEEEEPAVKFDAIHPFAWRGTLLPKTDGDIWLAAAFAEYEKVVALENSLKREAQEKQSRNKHMIDKRTPDGLLSIESRDLIDLALFAHESGWQAAARRLGRDVPLNETKSDPAREEWYEIAKGKGVLLLAALRASLGGEVFDRLMDEFGREHAGREVTSDEFVSHFRDGAGKSAADILMAWLGREPAGSSGPRGSPWTIYAFEPEAEKVLIVQGTSGDRDAQREAALLLQRTLARRFSNYLIPIKTDAEIGDEELAHRHLLLIGRPATNRISARLATKLPVSFGQGSFTVRDDVYANAESAVIVAGDNPLNSRFSTVVYAGLGAQATWKCVQYLEADELPPPQVLLMPAGRKVARFRTSIKPTKVARPE